MQDFSFPSLAVGLVIGLIVGGGIVYVWLRASGRSGDAASARRREEAFREEVADHFVKTAELVNRLTDSYKEVFDHLRDGADHLVDEEILRQRLAYEQDEKVTLRRIGYGSGGDASREETADEERR